MKKETVRYWTAVILIVLVGLASTFLPILWDRHGKDKNEWAISTMIDTKDGPNHVLSLYMDCSKDTALRMSRAWISTNVPDSRIVHVICSEVGRN